MNAFVLRFQCKRSLRVFQHHCGNREYTFLGNLSDPAKQLSGRGSLKQWKFRVRVSSFVREMTSKYDVLRISPMN
jgi:hypothetical protein